MDKEEECQEEEEYQEGEEEGKEQLQLRHATLVYNALLHTHTQLARNKQLSEFFVRDLNANPDGWAFADKTFDAVVCCVSVQVATCVYHDMH